MLPPLLSSIQAAIRIVSNSVMPPRNLLPPDSVAAAPQAFVSDTISAGSSDVVLLASNEEFPGPDPIEHSSSFPSAEGRSLSTLSIAEPELTLRASMEEEEEGEKEEGAMEEFDFEHTSTASGGPFLSASAALMEEEDEGLFDAEDYPVPQVDLPEYDPNDPLWMYIDTWLKTPELPDPFFHVPAQYHQSLETYLNTVLAPPPQEAGDDTDSSSKHDPVPLGADPDAQDLATLHGPATPAPMTEDVDDLFMIPTTPVPWSALWVMGDDDEAPDL